MTDWQDKQNEILDRIEGRINALPTLIAKDLRYGLYRECRSLVGMLDRPKPHDATERMIRELDAELELIHAHEVGCPARGASVRARMADAPGPVPDTGQARERWHVRITATGAIAGSFERQADADEVAKRLNAAGTRVAVARSEPSPGTVQAHEPGYERIAEAIRRELEESAEVELSLHCLDVDHLGYDLDEPYLRLAQVLDKAGLIDWTAFNDSAGDTVQAPDVAARCSCTATHCLVSCVICGRVSYDGDCPNEPAAAALLDTDTPEAGQ